MNESKEIFSLIGRHSGFLINRDNREKIENLVCQRRRIVGIRSPDDYCDYLNSVVGADELGILLNHLTVGETFFFRNRSHWRALREFVLPSILQRSDKTGEPLKFWSNACSTGEEPYTLAIALLEGLRNRPRREFEILATDVNWNSVDCGKRGIYTEHSFRGVPQSVVDTYFHKKRGAYRLENRIRQLVDFETLNLVSDAAYPARYRNMDVIFCRNALMYFQPKVALRVLERLVDCLRDDGFLFLGHSEGFMVPDRLLARLKYGDTFLFQKRDCPDRRRFFKTDVPVPTVSIAEPPASAVSLPENPIPSLPENPVLADIGRIFEGIARTKVAETPPGSSPQAECERQTDREKAEREGETEEENYRRAFERYLREEFEPALAQLAKIGDDSRKGLRELLLTGLLYYNTARLDQAERYWQKAFERSDTAPEGYVLESLIREAQSDVKGAMKANRKAIFLDRSFFAPYFRLGTIYRNAGDPQKAGKHFLNALKVLDSDRVDRVQLFHGPVPPSFLRETIERYVGKTNDR